MWSNYTGNRVLVMSHGQWFEGKIISTRGNAICLDDAVLIQSDWNRDHDRCMPNLVIDGPSAVATVNRVDVMPSAPGSGRKSTD